MLKFCSLLLTVCQGSTAALCLQPKDCPGLPWLTLLQGYVPSCGVLLTFSDTAPLSYKHADFLMCGLSKRVGHLFLACNATQSGVA